MTSITTCITVVITVTTTVHRHLHQNHLHHHLAHCFKAYQHHFCLHQFCKCNHRNRGLGIDSFHCVGLVPVAGGWFPVAWRFLFVGHSSFLFPLCAIFFSGVLCFWAFSSSSWFFLGCSLFLIFVFLVVVFCGFVPRSLFSGAFLFPPSICLFGNSPSNQLPFCCAFWTPHFLIHS
ncbi:hypothetical protein BDR26DRAFT_171771 [Obelidium mucronatum]|nr:hypothetical protein BDR26DRAFT_171771 [Obelidium mucronatum]